MVSGWERLTHAQPGVFFRQALPIGIRSNRFFFPELGCRLNHCPAIKTALLNLHE
jgi:hypothetical protein